MKKYAGSYKPFEPLTFREYCEGRVYFPRLGHINDDEWFEKYDYYEERFFADYMANMKEIDYIPEIGLDY